jgi:hypothetical protein
VSPEAKVINWGRRVSRAIHTTINNMLRIWNHNSIRIIKLLYLNIFFALNYLHHRARSITVAARSKA